MSVVRRAAGGAFEAGTSLRALRFRRGTSALSWLTPLRCGGADFTSAKCGPRDLAGENLAPPDRRTPAKRRPYLGNARRRVNLGRRGFTLLEVLLAFAMFSVAVVVLASSYLNIITSLEAVKTDRAFDQEVRWVREQVLQESDRKEVEKGGELTTPESGAVRWQATVFPAAVADLFTIDLRVELVGEKKGQQELREHAEQLTVLRPSWSEPVERGKLFEDAKQRIEEDRRRRGVVPGRQGKDGNQT